MKTTNMDYKEVNKVLSGFLPEQLIEDGERFLNMSHWSKNSNDVFEEKKKEKGFPEAFFNEKLNRIYIGIACEFFLKALFITKGFDIYKYELIKPLKIDNPTESIKRQNRTIELGFMIDNIKEILSLQEQDLKQLKEGMEIIRKWRNGEIHISNNVIEYDPCEHNLTQFAVNTLIAEIKKLKNKSK